MNKCHLTIINNKKNIYTTPLYEDSDVFSLHSSKVLTELPVNLQVASVIVFAIASTELPNTLTTVVLGRPRSLPKSPNSLVYRLYFYSSNIYLNIKIWNMDDSIWTEGFLERLRRLRKTCFTHFGGSENGKVYQSRVLICPDDFSMFPYHQRSR